jgi:LPXTG-site transpeptidase (sortase) family protein
VRVPLFWQVLPVQLLILSFFLLPVWQHHAAVANALAAGKVAESNLALKRSSENSKISGHPTRVLLPRLGIDLPVIDGQYSFTSSAWSVSGTTANYAQNTTEPNNKSDKTLIYGHWTPGVFGPTKGLESGDLAYVYTDKGHILVYRYEYKEVVKPTDTAIFNDFKGRPGLVLMTCQGSWAQERRLMFFNLQAAK